MRNIPKPVWIALLILVSAALVPVACISRSRAIRTPSSQLHLFYDMDNQGRYKSQQANPMFADRRASRAAVQGTIPRGWLRDDEHLHRGIVDEQWATALPMPITGELLQRGRDRYNIYCSPCHGLSGYGDGMVARRADRLQQGTWVPPASLHDEPAVSRDRGHLFNSITNGIRTMAPYGSQIPVEDRWAIVGYVNALQRSQRAGVDDVPRELRASLR